MAIRCSQGLSEYLSEESEEDDIMIAPIGVIKSFLAGVEFGKVWPPPIPAKLFKLKYLVPSST